jgi:penicillin-binding protein 1B
LERVDHALELDHPSLSISYIESDTLLLKEHLEHFLLLIDSKKDLNSYLDDRLIQTYNKHEFSTNKDFKLKGNRSLRCFNKINCLYIPSSFSDLNPSVWKTLISVEDNRFFEHKGIDFKAIFRALLIDIKAMRLVQGGSTLTQQLVKNIFLTNDKKLMRKFKEVFYSSLLEFKLEKDEIILAYLNNVSWGSYQGVELKGIKAASFAYFKKAISDITIYEASILIAMLKGPFFYHPVRKIENLKKRVRLIESILKKNQLLSHEDIWSEKKWSSYELKIKKDSDKNYLKSYLNYTEPSYLSDFEQFVMNESVNKMKKQMKNSFLKKDIGIKVLLSKNNCQECHEYRFYNKNERDLKRAFENEQHSIGSIVKPLVYELITSFGVDYNYIVSTDKVQVPLLSGRSWEPKDYSKAKNKFINLREALRKSKNIPLIRVAKKVGFLNLEKKLISYVPQLKLPLSQYPAQLLGALELSMVQIKKLYLRYFNEFCTNKKENSVTILSDAKTNTLSGISSDLFKSFSFFGKTGTTNKALDNWFVGYTNRELFIAWTGQETNRDKTRLVASGSTTSYRIYEYFMKYRGKRLSILDCY